MKNNPKDVNKEYLNIVPYYVIKNPSEPSFITSAMSYIFLGPESLSNISQRIKRLTPRNIIAIIKAVNEIKLNVDYDTKIYIKNIRERGLAKIKYFNY